MPYRAGGGMGGLHRGPRPSRAIEKRVVAAGTIRKILLL